MSDRFKDYKGSSRSRDDSRAHRERRRHSRSRSRSRSPVRYSAGSSSKAFEKSSRSRDKDTKYYEERRKSSDKWDESKEEVPPPPPPPRITKVSIGFQKPKAPIKMTLGNTPKHPMPPAPTLASVFNADDDDDEPEEMPAEARMRMRNIGRETPTSAGPNSFGKTKQGFCDAKKVFEKNMKSALDTVDKPTLAKLPQTIYRIKGP